MTKSAPAAVPADSSELLMVSCRHCLRPVMLVRRFGDPEVAELERHARYCGPRPPFAREDPHPSEVLRHFRVVGDQA